MKYFWHEIWKYTDDNIWNETVILNRKFSHNFLIDDVLRNFSSYKNSLNEEISKNFYKVF